MLRATAPLACSITIRLLRANWSCSVTSCARRTARSCMRRDRGDVGQRPDRAALLVVQEVGTVAEDVERPDHLAAEPHREAVRRPETQLDIARGAKTGQRSWVAARSMSAISAPERKQSRHGPSACCTWKSSSRRAFSLDAAMGWSTWRWSAMHRDPLLQLDVTSAALTATLWRKSTQVELLDEGVRHLHEEVGQPTGD